MAEMNNGMVQLHYTRLWQESSGLVADYRELHLIVRRVSIDGSIELVALLKPEVVYHQRLLM